MHHCVCFSLLLVLILELGSKAADRAKVPCTCEECQALSSHLVRSLGATVGPGKGRVVRSCQVWHHPVLRGATAGCSELGLGFGFNV